MQRSTERFLTTHTGSLPRPPDLVELIFAYEEGRLTDEARLAERVAVAVHEAVQRQVETGLDVVNDGEMSKPSYSTYVKDRVSGYSDEGAPPPFGGGGEEEDFPGYQRPPDPNRGRLRFPVCTGLIRFQNPAAVERDIASLRAALTGRETDLFLTAASPGQIARFMGNRYYPSHEAYVFALAEAMQPEYEAIAAAGLVLQLDCPDLASGRNNSEFARLPFEEWRKIAFMHVEAMNQATRNIPREQLRVHLCWGNYAGPHQRDVPLADILDIALAARCGGLSFEAANPRHAHEWKLFSQRRLPDGLVLIPGVIDSCTPYIEHPELVAERLVHFAGAVGRENVIGGTDCGFGTFVGAGAIHPAIAWAKLRSLAEGAALASAEVFGTSPAVR